MSAFGKRSGVGGGRPSFGVAKPMEILTAVSETTKPALSRGGAASRRRLGRRCGGADDGRATRAYYQKASNKTGVTGELLLQQLETRLDNVAYRLGFAISRRQARQVVRHGHLQVNGRKVTTTSGERTLTTSGAEVVTLAPDWKDRFLAIITEPSVALILMMLGVYGLFFEFTNPGFVLTRSIRSA